MKQNLKIIFIYIGIISIALILLHFFPFSFNPQTINLTDTDELVVDIEDTSLINPILDEDTMAFQMADIAIKPLFPSDTVFVSDYLSCPSSFLIQLDTLNEKLKAAKINNEVVRILHFGDSQIEGDRITSHLREGFQKRFGGGGPGLNCILDPQHINASAWLISDDIWELKTVYDRHRDPLKNSYGILGRYALLPANQKGVFSIAKSPWAEHHAKNYYNVRLFVAPHPDSLFIKGLIREVIVINDTLMSSENLTEVNWRFSEESPALQLELESANDVAVLGCAMDSTSGVAVDNIALRGQSSPLLHRTDEDLFKVMGEHLNVSMVMLQFGTNMIPSESANYSYYRKVLIKQFTMLRNYLPNMPVLCIGIADAAKSEDGEIVSYRHLAELRAMQKDVALDFGFAYFDLFDAMGGEGKILEWAKHDPPLAMSDYIHFTRLGGKKAAQLIVDGLWNQFDNLDSLKNAMSYEPKHLIP